MTDAVTPPNPAGTGAGLIGDDRLVPDPTLMTIDALRREIAMLENLMATRLQAASELEVERLRRIDSLMAHAEEMRQEQKMDTRAAVEAALNSQKEATHKMEVSVSDQITSLRENFETSIRGVHSSIADLKDRMTQLESIKQGVTEQRTEARQISAGVVAAIGVGVAVLLATLTVAGFIVGAT